ncbi:helix-turn-helix transcriptional regulator [Streptomyces drozdowiczii]|uniref:Helix-turn-helix transcriptional regulator n=1 Tax=Streptomyces drozdowiczii TaxID=202862 RepID=A0ABY6PU64_9ACTN|nr:helix-turn-helix transcriptional regulator [Streptomyces drozdowiczii]UZK55850.1 helix-turn-helix transcriptional regulator [Streptomyces drozdowiczii]
MAKDIDGSAGVPQFYGKELRYQREAAGLTLEKLLEGSYYGVPMLSAIEHGARRMPQDLAVHVDRKLGTDFFVRRCEEVREAQSKGHAAFFASIAEAEVRARTINQWSGTLIPGLLQTPAYARAVIQATHPLDTPEEVQAKIDARQERAAKLLADPKKPECWVVLHESVIRHPLLEPAEMAEQLDHIAALVRSRRVVLQILPWNAATRPISEMPLLLLDFDDEPPLLYTEGAYHGQTIDDPGLVKQYRNTYDRLRAAALPPEVSLALLEKAAEEFRHGQHHP